jgi:hypothetical protein
MATTKHGFRARIVAKNRWPGVIIAAASALVILAALPAPAGEDLAGDVVLEVHREQTQGAFTMLIPRGWRTQGGMVPSGVPGNIVDLIEGNINFAAVSADGRSALAFLPKFYFQTPESLARSSGGMLNPQPGQMLNGCIVYPWVEIPAYLEQIVFPSLLQGAIQNVRFTGQVRPAPWLDPLVPRNVASRWQVGSLTFTGRQDGVDKCGRLYCVLIDIGGHLWTNAATFGYAVPRDQWQDAERVMEFCLRSFRLDPQWVARAAEGDRKRGGQYHELQKYMNGLDAQMQHDRMQTNSDINHETFKVLTEQMETYDPVTGELTELPMYDHAWTDGQGHYLLSDQEHPPVLDAEPSWRPVKTVNRNAPDYGVGE